METIRPEFATKMLAAALATLGLICSVFAQRASDVKITEKDLLAKHAESIGTAEARLAVQSVTIVGTAKATFFGRGGGIAEGITVLGSKKGKYLVAMKFNTSDYPFEKMGFDGNEISVGFVRPGVRSILGSFLLSNESAFETGIMSGTLSKSWPLLNVDEKENRIKYVGVKRIGGKTTQALEYIPKKGSDLRITLFFDPETYRHVRTEYKRVNAARQGANVDASAGQSETRYTMIEEFSDFRVENNLTLPHTYKISLEILSGNGTLSYEWLVNLQRFIFNQAIDDKDFKVDSY